MEDLAREKERKPTPGLLFSRLDISVAYAEGFFIRKAIAQNEVERKALAQIFKRNPGCFMELVDGSGIYRVTQEYLSKRRMLQLLKAYDRSGVESLRRALWSLFIIEHGHRISFKDEPQLIEGISYIVDNFSTDHAGFSGIIISVPQRSIIKSQTYVSPLLMGKIVRDGLDRFLGGRTVEREMDVESILKRNFLTGGIWPESEDDCHSDQRDYPGWSAPVSGRTKWKADLEILQTGKVDPGYIFGVYPK